MLDLSQAWTQAVAWLASQAVTPLSQALGLGSLLGDPHAIAAAAIIALAQVAIIALVLRPLESIMPAERWADRRLTRVDRLYTLLMVLGLLPLFSYLVLLPIANLLGLDANPADGRGSATVLDHWVPWLAQYPLLLFALYYVVYDLTYYVMHRLQHAIPWWWALHSMHHSQRQMSCWTNDRGSYLDAVLQSLILASVGLVMGVEPSEFALLTLVSELMQNLSHANVAIGFGRVLERVFVDPRFHRLHHMRVDPARPWLHHCNYGQVLSIWDVVFGTALYGEPARPTGVADPTVDADNERGLVAMQWETLKRFWGAFSRPEGWQPGEVAFSPDYAPVPVQHGEKEVTGDKEEVRGQVTGEAR